MPKGVNKINTNWAYLVYKIDYPSTSKWIYVHGISKGEGITTEMESKIKDVIISV